MANYIKASKRGGKTYYSAQVGVPVNKRDLLGKSVLTKYIGAVTESEAKRRAPAIVARLQAEIRVAGKVAEIEQKKWITLIDPPTEAQKMKARKELEKFGLIEITERMIEDVIWSNLVAEGEAVISGAVADAAQGTRMTAPGQNQP